MDFASKIGRNKGFLLPTVCLQYSASVVCKRPSVLSRYCARQFKTILGLGLGFSRQYSNLQSFHFTNIKVLIVVWNDHTYKIRILHLLCFNIIPRIIPIPGLALVRTDKSFCCKISCYAIDSVQKRKCTKFMLDLFPIRQAVLWGREGSLAHY